MLLVKLELSTSMSALSRLLDTQLERLTWMGAAPLRMVTPLADDSLISMDEPLSSSCTTSILVSASEVAPTKRSVTGPITSTAEFSRAALVNVSTVGS